MSSSSHLVRSTGSLNLKTMMSHHGEHTQCLSGRGRGGYRRWKLSTLSFCLISATCDAQFRIIRPELSALATPDKNRRPVSKTRSAIRADVGLDDDSSIATAWNTSTRMKDQPSVAELMLSGKNEFANRLLLAQRESSAVAEAASLATADPVVSSLLFYGIAVLALSSAVLTPAVFVETLLTPLSAIALLIPWLWIGRTARLRDICIVGLTWAIQVLPQSQLDISVVYQKIVPIAWGALKKMMVLELWSRIWRHVGGEKFFRNISVDRRAGEQRHEHRSILDWIGSVHEFLDKGIRKYTEKAITKAIERNVQAAIRTTVASVVVASSQYMDKSVLQYVLPFKASEVTTTK